MADHEAGMRPPGDRQIAEPGGVTAVVRPAEADGDPFAEERGPGHGEPPVRVPFRRRVQVLLGVEYAGDADVTGRVHDPATSPMTWTGFPGWNRRGPTAKGRSAHRSVAS